MEFEGIKVAPHNEQIQKDFEDSKIRLNSFIEENFVNIFTVENPSETFIEIKFDGDLEPLSVKNVLKILKHFSDREFVLRVCSLNSNSFAFYWRVRNINCVSSVECEAEDFCEFLRVFLIGEVQNEKTGVLPGFKFDSHQLINSFEACQIGDERGFNLLFLAAEAGNAKVVQSLLEDGMNVSCLVDGKIPADIAYEKKHLDVLLCLLMANSRFPRNFEMQEEANDCNSVLQISLNLRQAVLNEDPALAKEILNSNKNLRYFYDTNNESILTYALVNKKFEMYELLMSFHLSFGPREDFDEILQYLDADEERKLRTLHQGSSQKVVEKHLMILMANSFVAHDNFEAREKLCYIYDAYEYLNDIPVAKPILKAIAARRDFEIHFDFNRDSVVYLDPSLSGANGLFYLSGRILISAKDLLDPAYRNEVYGVMIHEFGHFAMCLVYKNECRPYFHKSLDVMEHFQRVSDFCKTRMELEPLIQSVYEDYDEDAYHPELIVRSPQLITQYNEDHEKLEETKTNFAPLHKFFEHQVVPEIEAAIPRIEDDADEAYNKALKKISLLQKALGFLFVFLIISCTTLFFTLYNPDYNWNKLSFVEQTKILNSVVTFKGVDLPLQYLMPNGSEGFEYLKSSHFEDALRGDLDSLNLALNSLLLPYIFLSPKNLTEKLWGKVLMSNVTFQGQNVVLNDAVSDRFVLSKLSSDEIKELLDNKPKTFGKDFNFTSFYIERKFIHNNGESTKNSNEVFKDVIDSRIFLLVDKPGSGKSTAFAALKKKFKEQNPEYWVELIELKNLIEIFKKYKGKSDEDLAHQIKQKIMADLNSLEHDLFVDRFKSGKFVFLWDGVDEISPDFDDDFLSVVLLFKKANISQFLSTRPENFAKINQKLMIDSYSLSKYSNEDREQYIKMYLSIDKEINSTHTTNVYEQVAEFIRNISSKQENQFNEEINNPLMIKLLVDIAIDNKLSTDLDNTYKVYEKFMNLKFEEIATKGEYTVKNVIVTAVNKKVNEIHMIHALEYIFGNSFTNYLNNTQILTNSLWSFKKDHNISDEKISKFGILTRSGYKVDFVHRTFAEFLVASYLVKNVYEEGTLRPKDMTNPIALLYNVAFNFKVRKVIQDFISNFLLTEDASKGQFDDKVIEAVSFKTFRDYFFIQESGPLFIKFFEKDERVMKILAKVDQYSNINDWLDEVLGISLGDKKSFIENNQLGLILIRSWQFERKGSKQFANFLKKSTKIFNEDFMPELFNASTYRNLTEISIILSNSESISGFLNTSSEVLNQEEIKEMLLNSVFIINNDFSNSNESSFFFDQFEMILSREEIKLALKKGDKNSETLFFKSIRLKSNKANERILELIEAYLSDQDIFQLFTKADKIHNGTLLMNAAQFQDFSFFLNLFDFTFNHTTQDQLREILLQADAENDTMLQYATLFPYPDNFLFLFDSYNELVTEEEIQNTFTNRIKNKLPLFADAFKSSSDELLVEIAGSLETLFSNNQEDLRDFLSRRNENGDTIFSLYKDNQLYEKKLAPFINLLNKTLSGIEHEEIAVKKLFESINMRVLKV